MIEKRIALLEELESKLRDVWLNYHHIIIPADSDLSGLQLFLLKFIQKRRTCTPSEIARHFCITLGAVTGLVDRLYKLGLVYRARCEEDRRVVLIRLTPKSTEILRKFDLYRKDKFLLMLENLKDTDIRDLTSLLEKTAGVLTKFNNK